MEAPRTVPFWQYLAEWLRRHDWTQTQLADAVGVHQTVVSKWLHSDFRRRARPGRQTMARLAEVLEVPLEDLLLMLIADQTAAQEAREHARAGKPRSDGPTQSPIDVELRRRYERMEQLIRDGYPRAMLLAVLDANIRMAEAAVPDEPPVSATDQARFTASDPEATRSDDGPGRQLTGM